MEGPQSQGILLGFAYKRYSTILLFWLYYLNNIPIKVLALISVKFFEIYRDKLPLRTDLISPIGSCAKSILDYDGAFVRIEVGDGFVRVGCFGLGDFP